MKKINLTHITDADKKSVYIKNKLYRISLGNSTTNYFKNRRKAEHFLTQTNRFLNTILHELNFIYINLFVEYRQQWFYFIGENHHKNKLFNELERVIVEKFNAVDQAFEFIIYRCNNINGNYFTFKHLFNINNCLQVIASSLLMVLEEKNLYASYHKITIFQRQCKIIDDLLNDYGKVQGEESDNNSGS